MATALITGASRGIGRELARRFARSRHDLILVSRSAEELTQLSDELAAKHGVRAVPLPLDLTQAAAPAAVAAELERRGITVDVLVNNAGVGRHGAFARTPPDTDEAMLRLNVDAVVGLTKLLLPGMLARRQGRVANLASTAAFQPGPWMAVYYASKAFVLSFSEALSYELAGSGVTVTAVCPGPTPTDFQRVAGMGRRQVPRVLALSVDRVAEVAYRAIMSGKRVVIPGWANRLLALASTLGPRRVATAVVGWMNRGEQGAGSREQYSQEKG
jgi:short-subunit dehydrogenase